ncbi:hypothetical protein CIC12_07140, partial [Burkholderia sp. SG-MS1]|nr:hypothetical protein [Paraburkholderia sp. SG-MS1]
MEKSEAVLRRQIVKNVEPGARLGPAPGSGHQLLHVLQGQSAILLEDLGNHTSADRTAAFANC